MSAEREHDDKVLHHYDGIPELDEAIPRWFNWLFYATIVWSALYMGYYWAYEREMDRLQETWNPLAYSENRLNLQTQKAAGKDTTNWDAVTGAAIVPYLADPKMISRGKSLYGTACAACHGADAKGSVGPDLTDGTWIHGGKPEEVEHLIAVGFLEKGMPGFKAQQGQKNVVALTAYVLSLGAK
jgi:cytochrome c oxidase cbb3-type subunit 3